MSTVTMANPVRGPAGVGQQSPRPRRLPNWLRSLPFLLLHLTPLALLLTGVDARALLLCGACYLLHMVGITAGYHRYFAHRSYKTGRAFQFALACLGCTALQKGPLWWAAQHRHHHRTSDTPQDWHSPVSRGFWRSHVGWVLAPESTGTDEASVHDLSRYPELRWLDRHHWAPALVLAGLCLLLGGWGGLVLGFFVSSVLSHHATFTVNSLCHLFGRRRYATADASRNNWLVALLTLGEGWHNNHHHYQSSANQGFFWWEIDVSYYLIGLLACLGLVWDVRTPPRAKLLAGAGAQGSVPTRPRTEARVRGAAPPRPKREGPVPARAEPAGPASTGPSRDGSSSPGSTPPNC